VNPLDPFKAKGFMTYDSEKIAKVRKVFDDMLGATMVDTHKELRTAWTRVLAKGATPDLIAAFAKLPIEQADLETLALKWENGVFRNEQINQWTKFSKEKFESVAK